MFRGGVQSGLLFGLFFLPSIADGDQKSSIQAEEFKGEAKVSVHIYKMLKGSAYRITAKGDGFTPQIAIPGQGSGSFVTMGSTAVLNPGRTTSDLSQVIFTPTESKLYSIKVDYALGAQIAKGPNAYTLTIERAVFKPHLAVDDSRLEIIENSREFEKGKTYSIMVTGTGFGPELQILEGNRTVATAFNGRWFGFGPDAETITTLLFAPSRTMVYRVVVGVGSVTEQRKAPLVYSMRIAEIQSALSVNGQLTKSDPVDARRGGPRKHHTVKLEGGKNYQIDLASRAFDAYLFLEDNAGNVLLEDDDSGGNLNARIIFRPSKTDTYRIVATTFDGGGLRGAAGPYTLTVVENPHAQAASGAPAPIGDDDAGDLPKTRK
jgi:hypothetical protein